MKAILLFLLFIIISLSEAAGPNLRSLRSIPNRAPRRSPSSKDETNQEEKKIQPTSDEPSVEA